MPMLKVKDVIDALQKLDPELPVLAKRDEGYDGTSTRPVDYVGIVYVNQERLNNGGYLFPSNQPNHYDNMPAVFIGAGDKE